MKRAALVLLALGACKKEATTPPKQAKTCDDIPSNPALAMTPEEAEQVVAYCKAHPEEVSAEVIQCMLDATDRPSAGRCGPTAEGDEPAPAAPRSEAEMFLDAIKAAEKGLWADSTEFAVGTAGLTPATPCCETDNLARKCDPDPSLWAGSPWAELEFAIDEEHFFQVGYTGTASEFTAIAVGDLDCDGTMVTYTLEGKVVDGEPSYVLTRPDTAD